MGTTPAGNSPSPPAQTPSKKTTNMADRVEYLALLETLNLPISLVDPYYTYRWVNTPYAAAHGAKQEEIIGKTVIQVWGAKLFTGGVKRKLDRCFEGNEARDEGWVSFPTLGHRYCEVVYVPQRINGSVNAAMVVTYDITERKETEERLAQSEQRFRDLSEASLEAIVFIENGAIVDANSALSRMFGYGLHEALGKPTTDFIAPDCRAFIETQIRTHAEGVYESVGIRKDGGLFPLEVHAKEVPVNGRHLRVAAVRDLTERKRMEAELERREREEHFSVIFQSSPGAMLLTTMEGHCVDANRSLLQIVGYTREEMIGKTTAELRLWLSKEEREKVAEQVSRQGSLHDYETAIRTKSGQLRDIVSSVEIVVRHEEHYFLTMFYDITERKRAERQILAQRDLAFLLAQTSGISQGLRLILEAAINLSGMENGGIWLKDELTGDLDLISCVGLTDAFVGKTQRLAAGSPGWSLMMRGRNVYMVPDREHVPLTYEEGMRYLAVMPILQKGQVIGSLNVGSRTRKDIPEQSRVSLEFLAAEVGNIIGRMQAKEQLEREVAMRKEAEKALEVERANLQEANAAFKVLLKHREEDRKDLEERLVSNVKQLVLPHVERLRKSRLDPMHATRVGLIEANLKEVLSPFLTSLRSFNFSPRQLEVVALIREGRTTKEIAEVLHVGKETVDKQRFRIRKKLNLTNEKANLRSFLLSII